MAATADQTAPVPVRPRLVLGALTWVHFLNDGVANYLPGILPLLVSERHMSVALVSSLMSFLTFAQMIQPLAGIWADRFGGRWFLVLSPLATVLGGIGVAYFASPWAVLLCLAVVGVGNNAFHPQALATARRSARMGAAGLAISVFLIGGEVGRALGPMGAGWLAASFGLDRVGLLALPMLLTWPLLLRAIPPSAAKKPAPLRLSGIDLAPAAKFTAYGALRFMVMLGVSTFMPLWWRAHGGSVVTGAALVSMFVGTGIVGNLAGGALSDRIGAGPVVWSAAFLTLVLVALLPAAPGIWLWVVLGVLGAVVFAPWPSTLMAVQDIFPANPSLGSGIALGLGNGLGAVLFFPVGLVANRFGFAAAFDCLIAAAALSFLPVALVKAWRPAHWARRSR